MLTCSVHQKTDNRTACNVDYPLADLVVYLVRYVAKYVTRLDVRIIIRQFADNGIQFFVLNYYCHIMLIPLCS